MFNTSEQQNDFLKQFNISEDKFRESMLTWEELSLIAEDYLKKKNEHIATVKRYFDEMQQCAYVHSLGYRVKYVINFNLLY